MFYLLALLITLVVPLKAMDMDMERVVMDEHTPLIPLPHTKSPILSLNDDGDDYELNKSIFFNGSRRFYDQASRHQLRIQLTKKCLCDTLICTVAMGCGGAILGGITTGFMSLCGAQKACLCVGGGAGVCAGVGCISTPSTYPAHCYHHLANASENVVWDDRLDIPQEMLAAAQDTKLIWMPTTTLKAILLKAAQKEPHGRDDCLWPWLGRILSCYYRKEKLLINTIQERKDSRFPLIYYQLAQKFKEQSLSEVVIKQILHQTDLKEVFITEKELVSLMQDLGNYGQEIPVITAYAHIAILAQNGWLAFERSEQYPIRCEIKYFDIDMLPEPMRPWYGLQYGPPIYLPDSAEILTYYAFDKDPAYHQRYRIGDKKVDKNLNQEILKRLKESVHNNNNI